MRSRLLCLLLLIVCLLSGCKRVAERIYTLCKIDEEFMYYYNNSGEFFRVDSTGKRSPVSGVGLKQYPALWIYPCEGEYGFTYNLPGNYSGTRESVNHYVYKLCQELGGYYKVTNADWRYVECYIYSDTINTRIIFETRGIVRIYTDTGEAPLYLTEV